MFETLKKIMAAAEELGDVTKFSCKDWLKPGEYKVDIEGKGPDGMTFEFNAKLKFPVPVTDQTEGSNE